MVKATHNGSRRLSCTTGDPLSSALINSAVRMASQPSIELAVPRFPGAIWNRALKRFHKIYTLLFIWWRTRHNFLRLKTRHLSQPKVFGTENLHQSWTLARKSGHAEKEVRLPVGVGYHLTTTPKGHFCEQPANALMIQLSWSASESSLFDTFCWSSYKSLKKASVLGDGEEWCRFCDEVIACLVQCLIPCLGWVHRWPRLGQTMLNFLIKIGSVFLAFGRNHFHGLRKKNKLTTSLSSTAIKLQDCGSARKFTTCSWPCSLAISNALSLGAPECNRSWRISRLPYSHAAYKGVWWSPRSLPTGSPSSSFWVLFLFSPIFLVAQFLSAPASSNSPADLVWPK